MRYILSILAILLTLSVQGQKLDSILNGYLSPITRTGGSAPNFNFKGVFRNNSISNGFDTTDTDLNLIVANDGRCYQLPVTITSSPNPIVRNATIEGVATDVSGELSTIPTGVAAFVDLTDTLMLMPYVYQLPEDLKACIFNYNLLRLDTLNFDELANNGVFDLIEFNTNNNTDPTEGQINWSQEDQTLNIGVNNNVVIQTGRETVALVKNKTGSTIPNGTPVRYSGTEGNSGRILVAPAIADGSYPVEYNLGVATEDIPNNSLGNVTVFGKVRGVDLNGVSSLNCNNETWADTTLLYLDPDTAGCYTSIEPFAPDQKVLFAAIISASNNGTMQVRPSMFPDLNDVQGVNITNPQNGQSLVLRNGVWVNDKSTKCDSIVVFQPVDTSYAIHQCYYNGIIIDRDTVLFPSAQQSSVVNEVSSFTTIDTTVQSDYTVAVFNTARITSFCDGGIDNTITLPTPVDSIKGNVIEVTHLDTSAAQSRTTTVETDGTSYHIYDNFTGDTLTFLNLYQSGQTVRFTLQEVEGVLRWVTVNLSPFVYGDKELTAVGKVRQSETGGTYVYDNAVSGERKIAYDYVVDSIGDILGQKFELGKYVYVTSTGAKYLTQSTAVAGYTTDSLLVIPIASGFAVYSVERSEVNIGHLTYGTDVIDDTKAFRSAGEFLRYSEAGTVFVPKGNWYINENLNNYGPNITIYGNFIGAGRDSSLILVDSIAQLAGDNQRIFLIGESDSKGIQISGLTFDINGYSVEKDGRELFVVVLGGGGKDYVIRDNNFRRMTLNSQNTAGNTYINSFGAGTELSAATNSIDTVYPGTNVSLTVENIDLFYNTGTIIINGVDTTSVADLDFDTKTLTLSVLRDTIFPTDNIFYPTWGIRNLQITNNIFERCYYGGAIHAVAMGVWMTDNIFRENGSNANQGDTYNQAGFQYVARNWFQGGEGYGYKDSNKQQRPSGSLVIVDNIFFNKIYGIQIVLNSNPVTWYAGTEPYGYMGNRVMSEGSIISNNVFHSTPGNKQVNTLQIAGSFGGLDPNSVLKGNGSILYSNNTHIGHAGGIQAGTDDLDIVLSDNIWENNDTLALGNINIILPDSALIRDCYFNSRNSSVYTISGDYLDIDGVVYNQFSVDDLNTRALSGNGWSLKNSSFHLDTVLTNIAQTNTPRFFDFQGRAKDCVFSTGYELETVSVFRYDVTNSGIPDFIDCEFYNAGIGIRNQDAGDIIGKSVLRNNEGLRINTNGKYDHANSSIPSLYGFDDLQAVYIKTDYSNGSVSGELVSINADSTYTVSSSTSLPDAVVFNSPRLDRTSFVLPIKIGSITSVWVTEAVKKNDIVSIQSVDGKVSLGRSSVFECTVLENVTVWDALTNYKKGDVVEYNDFNFVAKIDNVNQTPPGYVFNAYSKYWEARPVKAVVSYVSNPNIDTLQTQAQQFQNNYTFTPFAYNAVDTIPVDTLLSQRFAVTGALDAKTITGIEYTLDSQVTTRSTLVRLLKYTPSTNTYTAFGAASITAGNNFVTNTPSQIISQGDIIYAEVTQAGDNPTGLTVTLKIE